MNRLLNLFAQSLCIAGVACGVADHTAFAQETSSLPTLRQQLLSADSESQIEAAAEIGSLGPYAFPAITDLVAQLKSENPAVQYECISAIGEIGPLAHDVTGSIEAFLSNESPTFQAAALEALQRIGVASPAGQESIRQLCGNPDAALRVPAVRCLLSITGDADPVVAASIPQIAAALGDERDAVRNEAALCLIEMGPLAVPIVGGELANPDTEARIKACEILGRAGKSAAPIVPELLKRLKDDDQLVVRAASSALGEIQSSPESVLPELEQLLTGKSNAVKVAAIRAIGEFGTEASSSGTKIQAFLNDTDISVRSAAVHTIGRLGVSDPKVISALVSMLKDEDGSVVINAANAISLIGEPAVGPLMKELASHGREALIVEILGEIGPPASGSAGELVRLLSSTDDAELQREIFVALSSMGQVSDEVLVSLRAGLRDTKAGDRRAGAIYVLANLGDQHVVPILKELVSKDTSPRVVRVSAWALVKLSPHDSAVAQLALPHLQKALSAEDALARREAASAIASIGPNAKAATQKLVELASSDPDSMVRATSLRAIAEIRSETQAVLPVALASLKDPDSSVRNAARFVIGRIGPDAHAAVPALRQAVRTDLEFDQIIAAWALVRVAPDAESMKVAAPFMLLGLKHQNPLVREEAAVTLGMIRPSTSEIQEALQAASADESPKVRSAAADSLKAIRSGK